MLDRVTITGADDSVDPADLLALSKVFPFVEWGILASRSRTGSPRYPSGQWIIDLQTSRPIEVHLSLHLCGRWVRQLLVGHNEVPIWLLPKFDRIQLNFHAESSRLDAVPFANALYELGAHELIFQYDGKGGDTNLLAAERAGVRNAVVLFDTSGGAGFLPDQWPSPVQRVYPLGPWAYHGYAGGLGPDNLSEQIPRILQASDNARIWIDMETHVRSSDGVCFDLSKVARCLEIAQPYIEP